MNKYKVYVYAICKNEIQFAPRWYASVREADGIVVLDTGSSDGTDAYFEGCEKVFLFREKIVPWRFDTARNRSLELVPEDADICVCTDLDEVLHPGWRAHIERAWATGAQRLKYRYTWNFNPDGSEGTVFWISKMHCRKGYRWTHPVHEVLEWQGEGEPREVYAEGVQLDHRADENKSRAQYLPLLELAVAEKPNDDRNVHYLGREYMFYEQWEKCINMLTRHLAMPTATWADERCASMRYLARANLALRRPEEALRWLLRACAEAPHLREPWLAFARFAYEAKDWHACIALCEKTLSVTDRPRTYITDAAAWGSLPWDILSVARWETGDAAGALAAAKQAAVLAPEDERIRNNVAVMSAGDTGEKTG